MTAELVAGTQSPNGIRTAGIRARLALEAGRMVSWEWDVASDQVLADQGFFDLYGLDAGRTTSKAIFAAMHPDDVKGVEREVAGALARDEDYATEFRVLLPDGTHRWVGARGAVTARGPAGEPLRMLGVNWDKSEQKLAEERLAMMANEMDHRVENAFAIMGALIQIGARTTDDKESYAARLRAQVQALASAHSLSAEAARRPDDGEATVSVAQIVQSALAAWTGRAENDQVTLAFRKDARLRPRQGAAMSMLAYELTTNAVKYGALSGGDGHVTVTLEAGPDGDAVLRWTERMGADSVTVQDEEAASSGFGTVLVSHCAKMLRGTVVRAMTPSGLRIETTFPGVKDAQALREEVRDAIVAMAQGGTAPGAPRLSAEG